MFPRGQIKFLLQKYICMEELTITVSRTFFLQSDFSVKATSLCTKCQFCLYNSNNWILPSVSKSNFQFFCEYTFLTNLWYKKIDILLYLSISTPQTKVPLTQKTIIWLFSSLAGVISVQWGQEVMFSFDKLLFSIFLIFEIFWLTYFF